jgi:hypothetical protein
MAERLGAEAKFPSPLDFTGFVVNDNKRLVAVIPIPE